MLHRRLALAKAGYATVELVEWAEPPHYDSVAHKLYWAKDLKFTDESAHTLNYNIRVLGRRGVLGEALTGTQQKKAGGVRARLPLRDHTCGTV